MCFRVPPPTQIGNIARLLPGARVSQHSFSFTLRFPFSPFIWPLLHFYALKVTMAEKEATVYIVDVGQSMGERRQGRSVTDLQWSMRYVWDRITATVRLLRHKGSYTLVDIGCAGGYGAKDGHGWNAWTKDKW